jgi:hypothetical protein
VAEKPNEQAACWFLEMEPHYLQQCHWQLHGWLGQSIGPKLSQAHL